MAGLLFCIAKSFYLLKSDLPFLSFSSDNMRLFLFLFLKPDLCLFLHAFVTAAHSIQNTVQPHASTVQKVKSEMKNEVMELSSRSPSTAIRPVSLSRYHHLKANHFSS